MDPILSNLHRSHADSLGSPLLESAMSGMIARCRSLKNCSLSEDKDDDNILSRDCQIISFFMLQKSMVLGHGQNSPSIEFPHCGLMSIAKIAVRNSCITLGTDKKLYLLNTARDDQELRRR